MDRPHDSFEELQRRRGIIEVGTRFLKKTGISGNNGTHAVEVVFNSSNTVSK